MITNRSKIAVIGAGFVGASTAYALALKSLASEIVLIDINQDKAEGEARDIAHGMSFMGEMFIHAGGFEEVRDSDIIIVTAGANRKPGETRMQLAQKNTEIARGITREIMKYYNTGVILVVANPVDVLTYEIFKESGLPKGRVFGTGAVLDTARFRYLLSEEAGVDVRNIHGFIAGEHGETQFAVWSAVRIAGLTLEEYCKGTNINIDKKRIEQMVRSAGAEVIERKGATYFAISSAIAKIAEVIIKDQRAVLNVSSMTDGTFGLQDVSLSLPTIVGRSGVLRRLESDFSEEERSMLMKSAQAIRATIDSIV
ncbi:L-lactate dehydrogenase [Candidatus Soleaferrea massiliensis]|uniref:L-lactate dehydrogenase n=1 Tax=Candidatus Soleaferrea massiliensis TaxID=1470354 RepID=UPI00058ACC04|nr:L-lactate dehydrogenase [Candidatus Soleaferrea massiliensis]